MLSFRHATNRNTKCYSINIAGSSFIVSYDTIIACRTDEGACRIENSWGPTTGRHMNDTGIRDWPVVTEEELQKRIRTAIIKAGLNAVHERLKGT
jgi:hypothetical protein